MKRGLALLPLLSLLALSCSRDPQSAGFALSDFTFPWSDKQAPGTEFRAYTADDQLHFSFTVEDRQVIVSEQWKGESTLDAEDRVERLGNVVSVELVGVVVIGWFPDLLSERL